MSKPNHVFGEGRTPGHRKSDSHSQSHSHRQHRTSGGGGDNKYLRECACGYGLACSGMTQAFRLLGDPRCYYVELPRYRPNPPAYKYIFRNNLRAAYLRHLKQMNPNLDLTKFDDTHRHYVALHHFHPAVVRAFYENPLTSAQKHRVPISITKHELIEYKMDIFEDDRILSVTGVPTGGYYFCPTYRQQSAHEDLKVLIKAERSAREAKTKIPSNIKISKGLKSPSRAGSTSANSSVSSPEKISQKEKEIQETKDRLLSLSMSEDPETTPVEEKQVPAPPITPDETADGVRDADSQPTRGTEDSSPTVTTSPDVPKIEDEHNGLVSPDKPDEVDEPVETHEASVDGPLSAMEEPQKEQVLPTAPMSAQEVEEPVEEPVTSDDALPEAAQSTPRQEQPLIVPVEDHGDDSSTEDIIHNESHQDDGDDFKDIVAAGTASEFDALWADEDETGFHDEEPQEPLSEDQKPADHVQDWRREKDVPPQKMNSMLGLATTTIQESDNEEDGDVTDTANMAPNLEISTSFDAEGNPKPKPSTPQRLRDHAWDTPKYRRKEDTVDSHKLINTGPAQFIDPTASSDSADNELPAAPSGLEQLPDAAKEDVGPDEVDDEDVILSDDDVSLGSGDGRKKKYFKKKAGEEKSPEPSIVEPLDPPGKISGSIHKTTSDDRSVESEGSLGIHASAVMLNHQLPGSDPTLRIQVHNDLIAWESKRRSDLTQQFEYHREQWTAARDILREGVHEVDFSERLVAGFSKAGIMFADSLQAIYDDKLLDDSGNQVRTSFFQNRLQKQRSTQTQADYSSEQSSLLKSIMAVQIELAKVFRENSIHMENDILTEIKEFQDEFKALARELESLGDSILSELKRSEIEVKNIWDVFDAMVTGDLMEYSVHGSMHGGSQHGGSFHSTFGGSLTGSFSAQSNSVHGFLTPRGEGEVPVVSSVHSPLVKATFRQQLGGIEDGWLIEMYYKASVAYQQTVFRNAEKELKNVFDEITKLEERRFRRLHQVMCAFVPRQRRLFAALPDPFNDILNDLVGLRIDVDSLQSLIDESIRDRSHDHLKRGEAHRSGIMNRSRLKAKDSHSDDVEDIEGVLGNPFDSSMVLVSRLVEHMPGGLRGIVNSTWKAAMIVVSSEGNLHLFHLPDGLPCKSSKEAFTSLCPNTNFESHDVWIAGRKSEIAKTLTPTLSLPLVKCGISVAKMRNRQVEIIEDRPKATGSSRFLNAVKDRAQGRKCTVRLPTASDATEFLAVLEKNKKDLNAKSWQKGNLFKF